MKLQALNSTSTYGLLTVTLHWLGAIGVITLFLLGEGIEHAKEDGLSRQEIIAAIRLHMSVGLLFALPLAARVLAHVLQPRPQPVGQHAVLTPLSRWVQRLLLFVIGAQLVTGPLVVWTRGSALRIFDWVTLASPFGKQLEWLHEPLKTVHGLTASLLVPLLVLHVAGALKHLVWDRDIAILRIVWPGAGRPGRQAPR